MAIASDLITLDAWSRGLAEQLNAQWITFANELVFKPACNLPIVSQARAFYSSWWNQHQSTIQTAIGALQVAWPMGPGELLVFPQLIVDTFATCDWGEAQARMFCTRRRAALAIYTICQIGDVQRLAFAIHPVAGAVVRAMVVCSAAAEPVLGPLCEKRLPSLADVVRFLDRAFALAQLVRKLPPDVAKELAPLFAGLDPAKAQQKAEAGLTARGKWTSNEIYLGAGVAGLALWLLFGG